MPPVEAIRTIASLLATAPPGEDFKKHGPKRIQVSVVDIKTCGLQRCGSG